MKVKILLLFIILTVVVFAKDISLAASVFFREPDFFLGKSSEITLYNDALSLAKSRDYASAKSLLSSLISNKNVSNPSDIYELYGDILFLTADGTGDTLLFYKKSLKSNPTNPRIDKKIALLQTRQIEPREEQKTQTWTKTQDPKTQTGETSNLDLKKEELRELQSQRSGMVESSAQGMTQKWLIDETFELLGTGAGSKNW